MSRTYVISNGTRQKIIGAMKKTFQKTNQTMFRIEKCNTTKS